MAALDVGARLGQDAADLFALIIQVVHPLDAQFQPAERFHGPRHGDRRGDGGGLGVGGGKGRAEQQGTIDALPGGAFESAAQPPAPGLLLARQHQRAVGGTGQRQLFGGQVGAFEGVVDVDGGRVFAYGLGAEGVAARQPVAPAGGRVQRVALRGEGQRRLVDGRSAHAQRLGELLAGDVPALGSGKRRQQGLLRTLRHGLFLLRTLCYDTIIPDVPAVC